jgi:hypothetical protein
VWNAKNLEERRALIDKLHKQKPAAKQMKINITSKN